MRTICLITILVVTLTFCAEAQIHLTHPNGGQIYHPGDTVHFTWNGNTAGWPVRLEYSTDGGSTWIEIADSVTYSPYIWRVRSTLSSNVVTRVQQLRSDAVTFAPDGQYGIVWSEFSPDSRYLLIAYGDYSVKLYDVRTGEMVRTLSDDNEIFNHPHFSSDGSMVVTRQTVGRLTVHDVETGEIISTMEVPASQYGDALFSPDNTMIALAGFNASGHFNEFIRLFDVATGDSLRVLAPSNSQIRFIAFSPDQTRLIAPSSIGDVVMWDPNTGEQLMTLDGNYGELFDGEFSPDGSMIVAGDQKGDVQIWSGLTGDSMAVLHHDKLVISAEFSTDGQYIITASHDRTAKVWEVSTGKQLLQTPKHGNVLATAHVSPDSRYFLTAAHHDDPFPRLWDMQTGELVREFFGHSPSLYDAAFSPDGNAIFTRDGSVGKLWLDDIYTSTLDRSDAPWSISAPSSIDVLDNPMDTPFAYPIPARGGIVTITFSAGSPGTISISLTDILGTNVGQPRNIRVEKGRNSIQLPVADLPAGQYFIELHGADRVFAVHAIVVQ